MPRVKPLRPGQRFLVAIFWTAFTVFCIAAVGKYLFDSVTEATITTGEVQQGGQIVAETPVDIPREGQYGNFVVPSTFREVPLDKPVFPVLEGHNYMKTRGGVNEMSFQVVRLINGSMSDDGTYNLRSSRPQQYVKSTVTVQGKSAEMFYDAQNMSATIYLLKGTLAAQISLSGDMTADPAQVIKMANQWQWK